VVLAHNSGAFVFNSNRVWPDVLHSARVTLRAALDASLNVVHQVTWCVLGAFERIDYCHWALL